MKKVITAASLGMAAVLLTACGGSKRVVGTIEELEHKPEKSHQITKPVYKTICKDTYSWSRDKKTSRTTKQKHTVCQPPKQIATHVIKIVDQAECWQVELTNGWEGCIDKDVWKYLQASHAKTYDSSKHY